ncbi:YcxB family protein [Rhizobacter sp. AJA081-3]|uniref:YcxB family protein n=1 Tax=Rhizobacter sp. AJA081-3 TaxID=2753607 RepID=UPI001AE014DC|nr:YcxB family protein [Rhizobacter sp. AJA081-3]QTN21533.1 YcxB family protein [Rhizobacter sp. AJA081-3]
MRHQATLVFTESLIREAVIAFWRRSVGPGFGVAVLAVAAGLVYFLWQGVSTWLVGALATVLLFAVLFATALYFVHYRAAIAKLRSMPSKQATLVAEDSHFSVTSELGSSMLPWSSVQELWRFENCWLLLFSKAQFITLPLACIPQEMQQFIASHVEAARGKNAP